MSVHNSDGCQGRCDAKCYNATQPICDCICHGMNHGKGLQAALDNTGMVAEKILNDLPEVSKLRVNNSQMQLFKS
jgi:hypothetical protein